MTTLVRYFHTVRHLRAGQFFGRVWLRVYRPRAKTGPAPGLRPRERTWVRPAARVPSLIGPARCRFLNEERDIGRAAAWDDAGSEKLWRYNLHYFDDLNAENGESRSVWHEALIDRWVRENPPGKGTGWEPYPTSLRIVNWIKWALAGNVLMDAWRQSLAVQARWLMKRLEWHLLGNHLFANAKALVFAGCFFAGPEARVWLKQGLAILERELPEQILPDGGHFERSPMYHALALEDVLDLVNLLRVFSGVLSDSRSRVDRLAEVSERMRHWLAVMCHPDGEISFFNDAAIGIAPSPAELERYAARLALPPMTAPSDGVTRLAASGYIRVQRAGVVALLDVAPVGPDYLPGHAHADTLSFELSLSGQRVLVNSGTSVYGSGPERQRQRGTAAHNTVTLDDADSSEVWGGFRVARRARPVGLEIEEVSGLVAVVCGHDGYRRFGWHALHRREWIFGGDRLVVRDRITGCPGSGVARFHLHPAATVDPSNTRRILAGRAGVLRWQVLSGAPTLLPSTYHPEFGRAEPSECLAVAFDGPRCETHFEWN